MGFRLQIFLNGRWLYSKEPYTTKKEAEARRKIFINLGAKPEHIKITDEKDIFY
jgi:hypothetical protein